MCIAIVKPKGTTISDEYLENCFENNPDGAGVAYSKDNELYIAKGIFNKDMFIKTVRGAEEKADGAILIHCRIGTSGLKDSNNCHPHIVNKNLVMIHNGILHVDVPKDSLVSDTVIFVQKYLTPLKKSFLKDKTLVNLIEMAIGSNNKLCFLDNKGDYTIINESAGDWVDGIWYSNSSYSHGKITYPVYDDEYYNKYWKNWWKSKEASKGQQSLFPSIKFNKKKRKAIKRMIENLSNAEIIEFGYYPLYNTTTNRIVSDTAYSRSRGDCLYLDDISEGLQEHYEAEIQLRGLDNDLVA